MVNKFIHIHVLAFLLLLGLSFAAGAQYNWKLSKDKGGIKVYESAVKNSDFQKNQKWNVTWRETMTDLFQ